MWLVLTKMFLVCGKSRRGPMHSSHPESILYFVDFTTGEVRSAPPVSNDISVKTWPASVRRFLTDWLPLSPEERQSRLAHALESRRSTSLDGEGPFMVSRWFCADDCVYNVYLRHAARCGAVLVELVGTTPAAGYVRGAIYVFPAQAESSLSWQPAADFTSCYEIKFVPGRAL